MHGRRIGKTLLLLLLSAAVLAVLTGCGGSRLSPEAVVEKYCAALRDSNQEAASRYLLAGVKDAEALLEDTVLKIPDSGEIVNLLKAHTAEMTYVVHEAVMEGSRASVTVEFTCRDVSDAMAEAVPDYVVQAMRMSLSGASGAEINREFGKIFRKKVSETEAATTEISAVFTCAKTGRRWKITELPEDALARVLSCNIREGFRKLKEQLQS